MYRLGDIADDVLIRVALLLEHFRQLFEREGSQVLLRALQLLAVSGAVQTAQLLDQLTALFLVRRGQLRAELRSTA